MNPLEVFAIDGQMNRATGSIPYTSLVWTRRYKEPGQFEIHVFSDDYDPSWAFIYTDDRPEMGIIQKVEFSDTAHTPDGRDTVSLSGFFCEVALNSIVFLDESPEQQKIYVPKPTRPSFSHKEEDTTIYQDPMGDYYYTSSTGDVVSADNGRIVSTNGLKEVDYRSAFGNIGGTSDVGYSSRYYYYSEDKSQINVVMTTGDSAGEPGSGGTYDISFTDDKGNVFYRNEFGTLCQAVGVVEKYGDTYSAKLRNWNSLAADEHGRYYTVTVQGPWQRTEVTEPITEGDSIQIVLKWARRMMGDTILYEEPTITGVQKKVDPSFQYLGDLLYSTLYEVGASFRLEYEYTLNQWVLRVYRGADRTQEQTKMPWAVFSDTWGTIYNYSASQDTSNYKNRCYVLYEYDKPKSFDSNGWPHADFIMNPGDLLALPTSYGIPYTSMRGYNTEDADGADMSHGALETYLDIRDEKPSCDSAWKRDVYDIPGVSGSERDQAIAAAKKALAPPSDAETTDLKSIYEAFEASIPGRGKKYLAENYPIVTNLDTGVVDTSGYLRDWDLGDLVEMEVSTVGLVQQARIIEVEEVYESQGDGVNFSVNIQVGDTQLSQIDKAVLASKTKRG